MTFFTSDPHYWHSRVIASCNRPFQTVEEMNEALIERHNAVVRPDDLVYYLGDLFFCGMTKTKEILGRLHGRKRLIAGNHDWGKLVPRRAAELGFEWIRDVETIGIGGKQLIMSHFPYRGGGDKTYEERYTEHRLENDGGWLLHGHVHCAWKLRDRMINVGVDVWDYRPVSIEEIEKILDSAP